MPGIHEVHAAAAKSLQSCPTLCNPLDSSPPGSTVPGILQARILEWAAISFSKCNTWIPPNPKGLGLGKLNTLSKVTEPVSIREKIQPSSLWHTLSTLHYAVFLEGHQIWSNSCDLSVHLYQTANMGNSFEDGISWLLMQPIPSWNISELINSHSFIQQVFLSTNTLLDRCSARLPPGNTGVTRLSPCRHGVYTPVRRRRGKKKRFRGW